MLVAYILQQLWVTGLAVGMVFQLSQIREPEPIKMPGPVNDRVQHARAGRRELEAIFYGAVPSALSTLNSFFKNVVCT